MFQMYTGISWIEVVKCSEMRGERPRGQMTREERRAVNTRSDGKRKAPIHPSGLCGFIEHLLGAWP